MLTPRTQGFTVIEVLLVVALIALLGTLAAPVYQTFQVEAQLDTALDEVSGALHAAQLAAMSGIDGTSHGIHFEADSFTRFTGSTYTAADPENSVTVLPPQITLSSGLGTDLIYTGGEGIPSSTGTITLSSTSNTHVLTINALGTIEYSE